MMSDAVRIERGFTLLEILVVMAIIGVVSALVLVRLEGSDFRKASAAAEQLAMVLETARDRAILSGSSVAVSSDGKAYQFWTVGGAYGEWIGMPSDGVLAGRRLDDGVRWRAQRVNDHVQSLGERIVFPPDGVVDPFAVELSAGSAVMRIESDVMGQVGVHDAAGR